MRPFSTLPKGAGAVAGVAAMLAAVSVPLTASAQTAGASAQAQNCIRVVNQGSPPRVLCAGGGAASAGLPAYERWDNGAPAVGSGSSSGTDMMPEDRGISSVHDYGR